jgi:CelD/BcsL family acetyltransferase involved in cellulose biosynthesis
MPNALPAPALTVSLHEDWERLPVTKAQWNMVVARSGTNTIFQTFEWNDAWLAVYRTRWRPMTLIAHRGDELVAIAPLVVDRSVRGPPRVVFQGDNNADYQDFIGAPDHDTIRAFLDKLKSRVPGAVIELSNVPAASTTSHMIASAARAAGLWPLRRPDKPCQTLLLGVPHELGQQLIKKYRLRRPLNHFSRRGTLMAQKLIAPDDALAQLEQFFDQHIGRWQHTSTPSRFHDDETRLFFRELVLRLGGTSWLDFSVIRLDERPIAYHFGFCYAGTLTWYKPSFEIAEARHSPGLLLIRYLIERGLVEGLDEFDFTIGVEPFKSQFTNHVRANASWRLHPSGTAYAADRLVRVARRWIGKMRPAMK